MTDACERIMERIEEIRTHSVGFSKDTMRWRNCYFQGEFIRKKTHINDLDFSKTTQSELVDLFEMILRRYGMQM